MPELPDHADRTVAQTDLSRPLLVEAGAGTGKTTAMVERVLTALTTSDPILRTTLPHIAAITFTDQAALELKGRIRKGIEQRINNEPSREIRRWLSQAKEDLESAPIGTIHRFCNNVLSGWPVLAGVDVRFSVLDAYESDRLRQMCWDEWISAEFGARDPSPILTEALRHGINPEQLHSLGGLLIDSRDEPVAESLWPAAEIDWTAAIDSLKGCFSTVNQAFAAIPGTPSATLENSVETAMEWLSRLAGAVESGRVGAAMEKWEKFKHIPRSRDNNPDFFDATERFDSEIHSLQSQIGHSIIVRLVDWLSHPDTGFVRRYEIRKRQQGVVDFDDLLILTLQLLRRNSDVRTALRDKHRYLLVDEFQDTDPRQAEIVALIAGTFEDESAVPEWDRAHLDGGRLCVVGDPKQSIYRFRRADMDIYDRVGNLISTHGGRCRLSTNFRSEPPVIDAVNKLFERWMSEGDAAPYQPQYEPLEPHRVLTDQRHSVYCLRPVDSEIPEQIDEKRALEAEVIATAVGQMLDEGWLVGGKSAGEKPRVIKPGDIALLFRSLTSVEVYEAAFTSHGLGHQLVGGRTFFGRPEIHWLTMLLGAIEHPDDQIATAAALRSPFFGCSDQDLAATVDSSGATPATEIDLSETAPQCIIDAMRILDGWRRRKMDVPAAHLIREIFQQTSVLETYANAERGHQRVANLLKAIEMARSVGGSLGEVYRFMDEHRTGSASEGQALVGDRDDGRVNLMTIHGAKGLEFPAVFLPDLYRGQGGSGQHERLLIERQPGSAMTRVGIWCGNIGGTKVATAGWKAIEESDKLRDEAESVRLFYVAMTRAMDFLVLPRIAEDPKEKSTAKSTHNWLCRDNVWDEMEQWSISLGNSSRKPVKSTSPLSSDQFLSKRRILNERAGDAALRWEGKTARYARPSLHEGNRDKPDIDDTSATHSRDEAMLLGSLVHDVLELARLDGEPELESLVGAVAKRYGVSGVIREKGLDYAARALAADVVMRAGRAEKCWKEVSVAAFMGNDDGGAGVITTGICDLVFEENGRLILVDYKTDAVDPGSVDERAENYRPQLVAYSQAINKALGRPLDEVYLVFCSVVDGPIELNLDLAQ